MRIAIGADHKGYGLKKLLVEYLADKKYGVRDFGCFSEEGVDYPDIARYVISAVFYGLSERGILICNSGIGMSISGNRSKRLRAALCHNEWDAEMCRKHNDSNILVLGAANYTDGKEIDFETVKGIADTWLNTEYVGLNPTEERHERRVKKMDYLGPVRVSASLLTERDKMTREALKEFIKGLEISGIDSLHWDVIDGEYNGGEDNWDLQGPDAMKAARKLTKLPYYGHLMIREPLSRITLFNEAGCNNITFHYEACDTKSYVDDTINEILSCGRSPGIAIEPKTPVEAIVDFLPVIGHVLPMTVRTGFANQEFMDMRGKIRELERIRRERGLNFEILVDGGLNQNTAKLCIDAGADVIIASSYIRKHGKEGDYRDAINALRGL